MREKGCCKSTHNQVILVFQAVFNCGKGREMYCGSFQGSGSGRRVFYKVSVRNYFSPFIPFLSAVFCHKRTYRFVMSEPPPGYIGVPPPSIRNASSILRAIQDQATCGTPQGGGEVSYLLLCRRLFQLWTEIFLGSYLLGGTKDRGGGK